MNPNDPSLITVLMQTTGELIFVVLCATAFTLPYVALMFVIKLFGGAA